MIHKSGHVTTSKGKPVPRALIQSHEQAGTGGADQQNKQMSACSFTLQPEASPARSSKLQASKQAHRHAQCWRGTLVA